MNEGVAEHESGSGNANNAYKDMAKLWTLLISTKLFNILKHRQSYGRKMHEVMKSLTYPANNMSSLMFVSLSLPPNCGFSWHSKVVLHSMK